MPNPEETDILTIEPGRARGRETGIYVRAKHNGKWFNADIAELDKASLLAWLRSRGGENKWAESVVGTLLGHGAFDAN